MVDYQKSKIYKLYSVSNEELVYYGSTIQKLSQRLGEHVNNYKYNKSIKSKLVLDAGDYKIELIENYPCNNKQELEKREGYYIKNNVCVNKRIEGRTQKEYNEDNKEHLAEQFKEYYQNNKKKITEYNKNYYQNNKDKIKDNTSKYSQDNKEKLKEKITCKCGCLIRRSSITTHQKTPKHIKLMENK